MWVFKDDEEFLVDFFKKCEIILIFFVISDIFLDLGNLSCIFTTDKTLTIVQQLMKQRDVYQCTETSAHINTCQFSMNLYIIIYII